MVIDKYHLTFHLRESLENVLKNMVEESQLCEPSLGGTRLLASLRGYRASNTLFWGCSLAVTCTGRDGLEVFVVLCPVQPKAQLAVVLV